MKIWILLFLFHTFHITSPHPCPLDPILVPCPNQLTPCTLDSYCASIQQLHLKSTTLAKCDQVGVCSCPPGMIFTGSDCVPVGTWSDPYAVLRQRWHMVPVRVEKSKEDKVEVGVGYSVISSYQLKALPDSTLVQIWQSSAPDDCFTKHYLKEFKGQKILDIGSGFAQQSLQFALHGGALVTFLDLVQENLDVVERLAIHFGVRERTEYILLKDLETLESSLKTYDVMLALGSLQYSPREIIEKEMAVILPHLKVGGRLLQRAYPITRLFSTFVVDFTELGQYTENDGKNVPWTEWYEPGKLLKVLQSDGKQKFEIVWCGVIKEESIWFELVHTSNGVESCEYNKYLTETSEETWEDDLLNYILNTS